MKVVTNLLAVLAAGSIRRQLLEAWWSSQGRDATTCKVSRKWSDKAEVYDETTGSGVSKSRQDPACFHLCG